VITEQTTRRYPALSDEALATLTPAQKLQLYEADAIVETLKVLNRNLCRIADELECASMRHNDKTSCFERKLLTLADVCGYTGAES